MNSATSNSLSNLLDEVEIARDASVVKERKDGMKVTNSSKRSTKRGGKKKETNLFLSEDSSEELNASLSDLLDTTRVKTGKGPSKDSQTVATVDSLSKDSKRRRSKRSGKKKVKSLESSLSDMLAIVSDDDEASGLAASESCTVATVDSMKRSKALKKSKRGGKKTESPGSSQTNLCGNDKLDCDSTDSMERDTKKRANQSKASGSTSLRKGGSLSASLGKLGGLQKDFGRQADDNDTFCGLGTVGEDELQSGNSDTARKIKNAALPPPKKTFQNLPYALSSNDGDSDSEEEDLFSSFGGANPFRMPSHL